MQLGYKLRNKFFIIDIFLSQREIFKDEYSACFTVRLSVVLTPLSITHNF
jgi:hypothetical protein